MSDRAVDSGRVAVVLVRPRIPENVGAAARAMANTGFSRLIVVSPDGLDRNRAAVMATHGGLPVLKEARVVENLAEALGPFGFVVGTTARTGGTRKACFRPDEISGEVVEATLGGNDVALVFGPEDKGLSNEDLRFCHKLLTIPTADFSSLNLAHAVLLTCHTLFRTTLPRPARHVPRLANRFELDGMYGQLSEVLTRIGFINPQNPDHWMGNLRRFFSRLPLTAREVKILRGICRQLDWYTDKRLPQLAKEMAEKEEES